MSQMTKPSGSGNSPRGRPNQNNYGGHPPGGHPQSDRPKREATSTLAPISKVLIFLNFMVFVPFLLIFKTMQQFMYKMKMGFVIYTLPITDFP